MISYLWLNDGIWMSYISKKISLWKRSNLPSSDSQLSNSVKKIFLMSNLFQQSIHSQCSRCECSRDEKIQNDITGLTVFIAWKWSFQELFYTSGLSYMTN